MINTLLTYLDAKIIGGMTLKKNVNLVNAYTDSVPANMVYVSDIDSEIITQRIPKYSARYNVTVRNVDKITASNIAYALSDLIIADDFIGDGVHAFITQAPQYEGIDAKRGYVYSLQISMKGN